jgi:hypothetical protein
MQLTLIKQCYFSALTTVLCLCLSIAPQQASANEVDVIDVKVHKSSSTTFRFSVTLRHKDTGWDHYADAWEVLSPDGTILGKRVLHHPHVNEQPFTRSLSGVKIPKNIKEVTIRGHDKAHKYGGKTMTLKLPR